ncbi:VOC family protein [Pendulispora rubella]|uniref:VOC family protein n=1 Tax=Pendulispora rubella TaxID=2741070 RepID=A0ABZ2L2J9_9BACT
MLSKVAYVTLFVNDQDKALDFYTNVLGFEKRADNPLPTGTRFLTVGLAGQELQVVLWPGTHGNAKPAPGLVPGACIFETSDCRAAFETLKARGVEFETPQIIEQPVALVAIFRDPDGNRLMLRENRKP